MTDTATPQLVERARVTRRDENIFKAKLALVIVLLITGVGIQFVGGLAGIVAGIVILAATYTHMVELQHQCLHHSAFRAAKWHRTAGVPLGLPLLVSYSHYRVRHLQHHRFLGTPDDSEFFGFDTRKPITWGSLLAGAFDYRRLLVVLREIGAAVVGRWDYPQGQISPRRHKEVVSEYRFMGALLVAVIAIAALGSWQAVLQFWFLPLLVAAPIHFLVELPEHVLCESDTQNVLRNTRSITGSPLTTWFTNGNNLHVEHHAAMAVPINRLRRRHPEVQRIARHVERSYLGFYWRIAKTATRNTFRREVRTQGAEVVQDTQASPENKTEALKWLRF